MQVNEKQSVWHFDVHSLEIHFRDKVIKVRQPYPVDQPDPPAVDRSCFQATLAVRTPLRNMPGGGHQKLAQPALVLTIDEVFPHE